jgi:hypothetical protein
MNKMGVPAPDDYRSDGSSGITWMRISMCFGRPGGWRPGRATAAYLEDPVFRNFQEKTVGPYIDSWVLEADSLLTRPAHPNAPDAIRGFGCIRPVPGSAFLLRGYPQYEGGGRPGGGLVPGIDDLCGYFASAWPGCGRGRYTCRRRSAIGRTWKPTGGTIPLGVTIPGTAMTVILA